MNTRNSTGILFLLILFAICCRTAKVVTKVEPNIRKMQEERWLDYSIQQYSEGKRLYENKCERCHELKDPLEYSESDWLEIIPDMAERAELDKVSKQKIERYIVTTIVSAKQQKPVK